MLAGEESSLAPLPFPNLGASTASAFSKNPEKKLEVFRGGKPILPHLQQTRPVNNPGCLTFFLLS
jgi:hypothetical protein